MKERPIPFTVPMVRAILEGRKTQTRRVIKPQPIHDGTFWTWKPDSINRSWTDKPEDPYNDPTLGNIALRSLCPYGQPGDRLWVKETFRLSTSDDCAHYEPCGCKIGTPIYRASWSDVDEDDDPPWKPSRFMPRWASRITLEITAVRVERIQDISAKDILSEGAVDRPHQDAHFGKCPISRFDGKMYVDLRSLWASAWDSINAKRGYGWDDNPWVWVIEFKKL